MENQKHIEAYQDLFNCLSGYGLILLQSEIDEIIDLSQKAAKKYDAASESESKSIPKENVSDKICPLCRNTGKYSFSTFGGETTTTHTCFCKRRTGP